MKINDFNSELELMNESDVISEEKETSVNKKPMSEKTEILSKRGSHSKTFQEKKGRFETIFYNMPIHHYNEDDKLFVSVDGDVEEDEKAFKTKKHTFEAIFHKEENSKILFAMKREKHQVCVSVKNQFGDHSKRPIPTFEQDCQRMRYANVSHDTDYNCSVTSSGIKVDVVKSSNQDVRNTFMIACENLRYIWDENDKILRFISNESEETVFEIPAPFIVDAAGTYSENASFEIVSVNESVCEMSIIVDQGWLSSKERKYPVSMEWSITDSEPVNNGFVFDRKDISADGKVVIGGKPVAFKMHLPKQQSGVLTKRVKAIFHCEKSLVGEDKKCLLVLSRVVASNEESEPVTERIGVCMMSADKSEYAFDVMSEYGVAENASYALQVCEEQNGELVATENTSAAIMTLSADSAISTFAVSETDGTTEEDSSSGVSGNIGSVGTYEVDLLSGRLNMEMKDFVWEGNRMPVSISRSYRGQFSQKIYGSWSDANGNFNNMMLGFGWRMNLMQSMIHTGVQKIDDAYKDTYTYTDESGTETIFAEGVCESGSCTIYKDINGLGYTYEDTIGVLTKGSEKHTFTAGRLTKIVDGKNIMTINYSSGRISSVVDGVGRIFEFEYTNNYLSAIKLPNRSVVEYQYCNGNLDSVIYPNGQKLTFTYNTVNNQPSAVTVSGNQITMLDTYFNVSSDGQIVEVGTSVNGAKSGKYTTFYYTNGKQTIVNEYDRVAYGKTNNADIVKRSVYLHETPQYNYTYYDNAQHENKIDLSGTESISLSYTDPGIHTGSIKCINLLKGHNFGRNGLDISLLSWNNDFVGTDRIAQCDPVEKMPGRYAAHLINLHPEEKEKGIYQSVSLTANTNYVFSCYLKLTARNTSPNKGVYLWVKNNSKTVNKKSEMITTRGDFVRVAIPFTAVANEEYTVGIYLDGDSRAKVVAPQLEEGKKLSPYNYLSTVNSNNVIYIIGDATQPKEKTWGKIKVAAGKGVRETFTLSGYVGGGITYSNDNETCIGFRVTINYSSPDISPENIILPVHCEAGSENRQFAMLQFCKSKYASIDNIEISCLNHYNTKIMGFWDLQLIRNSYEDGLTEKDFVINVNNNEEDDEDVYVFSEDDFENITFEEVIDTYGNVLTGTNFKNGEFGTIYTEQKFADSNPGDLIGDEGNNKTEEADARGNTTRYEYDPITSKPIKTIDRCNNAKEYTYDTAGRVKSITVSNDGVVNYEYNSYNDLTEITRGDNQKYSMEYDAYRNLISVNVGSQNLAKYDYRNGGNHLKSVEYANGAKQVMTYDRFGNVIGEAWDGIMAYRYFYDPSNRLVKTLDIANKKMYNINMVGENVTSIEEYDVASINASTYTVSGLSLVGTMHYSFASDGKQFRKKYVAADGTEQKYVFDFQDEQNVAVQLPTGVVSHAKSDHFGRKVFDELQLGKGLMSRTFTYYEGEITQTHIDNDKCVSKPETTLVRQLEFSNGRTIQYEYDAEERITLVKDSFEGNTAYEYDELGQLTKEIRNAIVNESGQITGNAVCFEYDQYGNIVTRDNKSYVYGKYYKNNIIGGEVEETLDWKDLLTYYNGQRINYDDQGNPTNYIGTELVWEKGRQLKRFGSITYTYNNNGIRTSKTADGVKHTYVLDGSNIVKETWGNNTLVPLYDLDNTVCGINYNGTAYYFYKNLQGDVVAIANNTGTVIARYVYDAWGKVLSINDFNGNSIETSTHVANINPFRYRGYYYDAENRMYYLQNRYYDPEVGRFINADDVENFCSIYSVFSNNAFCYCDNNPVNETDDQGDIMLSIWKLIGKMFLGAITNVFIEFVTDLILTLLTGKARDKLENYLKNYAEVACVGALEAVFETGSVGDILRTIILNSLEQFVNLIRGKAKRFDVFDLIMDVLDSFLSDFLEDKLLIKEPVYIRDIKKEARGLGIKGKKNLEAYLEAKSKLLRKHNIRISNWFNIAYNIITNFIDGFLKLIFEWIASLAEYIREVITARKTEKQYA